MVKDMIQLSYLTIVADITIIIMILYNSALGKERQRIFLVSAAISVGMIACNIICYSLEGTGHHISIQKAALAVSYSISGPVILPFVYLSGIIQKKLAFFLNFMVAVNAVLSFTSIFNGCIFRVDSGGNVTLGSLSPIPFYFSAVYLAALLYCSVLKYKLGFHGESAFILLLSGFIVSAVIMNTFLGFKFLISGMAVLSNLFYYTFFTNRTLTRDALTNALNRHSFYKDIEIMNKHDMFVISMDLNGLKQINDTQGHDEGDKAICAVSDSTFSLLPAKARFYRMGGDEFEILCPGVTHGKVEALIAALKDAVENKGYSVAIGFKEFRKGMKFDEILNAADEMMYADKARMKKTMAAMESVKNARVSAQAAT